MEAEGASRKAVKQRVKLAWMKWRGDIAWIRRTEEELQRKILNWQNELKIRRFEDEC